jgi:hypothetical protein
MLRNGIKRKHSKQFFVDFSVISVIMLIVKMQIGGAGEWFKNMCRLRNGQRRNSWSITNQSVAIGAASIP